MLFSGPMVRAILAGRKTQTRRFCKLNPAYCERWKDEPAEMWARECPYGKPGDRLWVRETFVIEEAKAVPHYRATEPEPHLVPMDADAFDDRTRWRPSIYMPRWASRITLELTQVRVERLQAIGEDDARAEGILFDEHLGGWCYDEEGRGFHGGSAVRAYEALWCAIHGPASWAANPWVWALTFRRL